jgi:hypothetical protein
MKFDEICGEYCFVENVNFLNFSAALFESLNGKETVCCEKCWSAEFDEQKKRENQYSIPNLIV